MKTVVPTLFILLVFTTKALGDNDSLPLYSEAEYPVLSFLLLLLSDSRQSHLIYWNEEKEGRFTIVETGKLSPYWQAYILDEKGYIAKRKQGYFLITQTTNDPDAPPARRLLNDRERQATISKSFLPMLKRYIPKKLTIVNKDIAVASITSHETYTLVFEPGFKDKALSFIHNTQGIKKQRFREAFATGSAGLSIEEPKEKQAKTESACSDHHNHEAKCSDFHQDQSGSPVISGISNLPDPTEEYTWSDNATSFDMEASSLADLSEIISAQPEMKGCL